MSTSPNAFTVYVPRDSTAVSLGADDVAAAIAQEATRLGIEVTLVRNSSRGMFWLEPLVEVATPRGRIGYGPVQPEDVAGLFAAGLAHGGHHDLSLDLVDELPYLKNQERLTFARAGITDPVSLADYCAHSGYRGLKNALAMEPGAIVEAVTQSGLRGRGGAAFPAGIKWKTVLGTPGSAPGVADADAAQKYIVCNGDEGDSGTFADRMICEGDPFVLIEGMTIAGIAVGATRGYIYLRCEYPYGERALNQAIKAAYAGNWLGDDIQGSGKRFDLEVRMGAGAYICGEETSLLESLEGKRGMVRFKPPLPAIKGLFGCPTVINNVITLSSVPIILDKGAEHYKDFGVGRSRGTLPVQLAGNIKRGGLVEKAFGVSLRDLLYTFGGGALSGLPIRAVQVGGPLGSYIPDSQFDLPLDYEAYAQLNNMVGHGGITVFDDSVDMAEQARFSMEFCATESCGKCTPCRIGSTRGMEVIDRLVAGDQPVKQEALLRDLCDTMLAGSLCALGGMAPFPVLSALNHFPEDFKKSSSQPAHSAGAAA